MVGRRLLTWLLIPLALCFCGKGNYHISEIASALGKVHPGDTLRIAGGTYKDVTLVWKASASPEKPVVVMAAEPGKVRISGKSSP